MRNKSETKDYYCCRCGVPTMKLFRKSFLNFLKKKFITKIIDTDFVLSFIYAF